MFINILDRNTLNIKGRYINIDLKFKLKVIAECRKNISNIYYILQLYKAPKTKLFQRRIFFFK